MKGLLQRSLLVWLLTFLTPISNWNAARFSACYTLQQFEVLDVDNAITITKGVIVEYIHNNVKYSIELTADWRLIIKDAWGRRYKMEKLQVVFWEVFSLWADVIKRLKDAQTGTDLQWISKIDLSENGAEFTIIFPWETSEYKINIPIGYFHQLLEQAHWEKICFKKELACIIWRESEKYFTKGGFIKLKIAVAWMNSIVVTPKYLQ